MYKQSSQDWNSCKIIDDVDFHEEDATEFKKFLTEQESPVESGIASMSAGQILKGTIVELTKDFAVIDVGLKSEGLVPVGEFSDTRELCLGTDIEVYLDQTEGENGQIVLSR
ncbi:MAG: S1 RNA-binding domain-containing protein, partial [Chlamydiae bacterium]|nr:S1 RNA-binding domain-containing protein [Chlamydiota bacterium]